MSFFLSVCLPLNNSRVVRGTTTKITGVTNGALEHVYNILLFQNAKTSFFFSTMSIYNVSIMLNCTLTLCPSS